MALIGIGVGPTLSGLQIAIQRTVAPAADRRARMGTLLLLRQVGARSRWPPPRCSTPAAAGGRRRRRPPATPCSSSRSPARRSPRSRSPACRAAPPPHTRAGGLTAPRGSAPPEPRGPCRPTAARRAVHALLVLLPAGAAWDSTPPGRIRRVVAFSGLVLPQSCGRRASVSVGRALVGVSGWLARTGGRAWRNRAGLLSIASLAW